ncbi:MAG: hypothetical protein ABJL99_25495 [Aliishimia sp.]
MNLGLPICRLARRLVRAGAVGVAIGVPGGVCGTRTSFSTMQAAGIASMSDSAFLSHLLGLLGRVDPKTAIHTARPA